MKNKRLAIIYALSAAVFYAINMPMATGCWGLENNCTRKISGAGVSKVMLFQLEKGDAHVGMSKVRANI